MNGTRPERAGVALAKALAEMVHLMYQDETARQFLDGLIYELRREAARRRKL